VTGDEDLLGTVKLLAGSTFLLAAWSIEAIGAGIAWGALWGAPVFVAGVACGYLALRFEELFREAAVAWRDLTLRAFHGETARRLTERRRALANGVAQALDEAGGASSEDRSDLPIPIG
jgi:hypothetical protein